MPRLARRFFHVQFSPLLEQVLLADYYWDVIRYLNVSLILFANKTSLFLITFSLSLMT